LNFDSFEHPFQEEFEHEEIVADRYATTAGQPATTPTSQTVDAESSMENELPAESVAQTTEPASAFVEFHDEVVACASQPALILEPASQQGLEWEFAGAAAMLPETNVSYADSSSVDVSEKASPSVAASDRNVYEAKPEPSPKPRPASASPVHAVSATVAERRREYRQLFSQLRKSSY